MKARSFHRVSCSLRMGCCAVLAAVLIGHALPACAQVSPTTGCEVPPGRFLPVLVSLGHETGIARVNGKNVKAAGAGKVALWGAHQADIVYESLLYRDEQKNAAATRLTLLFSDALLRGEKVTCGPVRSLRDASASLREEWQGVLRGDLGGRLKGVKAPSNLSVDVNAVQARVAVDSIAHPFAFSEVSDAAAARGAGAHAASLTLDWGDARYLARFVWDEAADGYVREVAGWPFACYPTEEARMAGDEIAMVQPAFANVIVQWVDYDVLGPVIQNPVLMGEGTVDLFMGGQHVRGTWSRGAPQDRTVYRDEAGCEIALSPGKTWIALFPANAALIF